MNSEQAEAELAADIGRLSHDPLGFVKYVFPWGKGELAASPGPRAWQRELLADLGERLKKGKINKYEAIQFAVASGHGIGKSALVSWLVLWALSTFEDCRGVVTAGTEGQLRGKTWPELSKWVRLSLVRHWWTVESTSVFSSDPDHAKTWRVDAVPWNDSKSEAFSGLHNEGRRILLVFDEASAVSDQISEVAEGALTDANTELIFCKFGNPTRSSGHFRESCLGSRRHRWITRHIDSRTIEGVNQSQIQKWIDDFGEESDFVRVRVRGLFPNASSLQFIPSDLVATAMKREALWMPGDPIIMAIDVSRGGEDSTVIAFRRGLDARSIPWVKIPGGEAKDSMRVAAKVSELVAHYRPDAVFIDESGLGGPVFDRIRQLGINALGVQFGARAPDVRHANYRAYIWSETKAWLERGGAIPNSPTLESDLTTVEYFHDRHDRLCLESKEDMRSRGLASPDEGDALGISFAYKVAPKAGATRNTMAAARQRASSDYDPMARRSHSSDFDPHRRSNHPSDFEPLPPSPYHHG